MIMAITSKLRKDWEEVYKGFDTKEVGVGTIDPNIYSNENYRKLKTQKLLIGGINRIAYAGFEHDASPLILTMAYVPTYNVILSYNLHYVPHKIRKQMIEFVIKTNRNRIKNNQPIIVDYHTMKRAIPASSKIVRMYKVQAIRVIETFPLDAWGIAIKENSKWERHYKQTGKSSESIAQRFFRSIRGFF